MVAGYKDTRDVISFYQKGCGEFDEMRAYILSKEEVLYAFVRIESKFALITYISDKATGVKRARALVHGRAVSSLFKDSNLALTLTIPAELTEKNLRQKLRLDASGLSSSSKNVKSSTSSLASATAPSSSSQFNLDEQKEIATPQKPTATPIAEQMKQPISPPQETLPRVPEKNPKYANPPSADSDASEEDFQDGVSSDDEEETYEVKGHVTKPVAAPTAKPIAPERKSELKPEPRKFEPKEEPRKAEPPKAPVRAESKGIEVADKLSEMKGFVNELVKLQWKRRLYKVAGGKLLIFSDYPILHQVHEINLSNIDAISRTDDEIVIKNSLGIKFKPGTKEYADNKGESIYLFCDDKAALESLLKELK